MSPLNPIFDAVRQAAILCQQVQQKHIVHRATISNKAGAEPVTIADYGAQALICRAIQQHFPADGIIAEEGGAQFASIVQPEDQQEIADLMSAVLGESVSVAKVIAWLDYGRNQTAARTWLIDPIDGTKGFIALRHYAIAVGLLEDHRVIGGVMGTPGYQGVAGGALFHAWEGRAYVEPLTGGTSRQIHTNQRTDPATVIVAQSVEKAHSSQDAMSRVRQAAGLSSAQIKALDSQEKYALVAAGEADLYLRLPHADKPFPHRVWDHAAGQALVEAAGGIVTDVDGTPLDYSHGAILERNRGMVVANAALHPRVLEAIAAIGLDQP